VNPIDVPLVAASLTAAATLTASLIAARAAIHASRNAQQVQNSVKTPDDLPEIGDLVTQLLNETAKQNEKLANIDAKVERHLGWHAGHGETQ